MNEHARFQCPDCDDEISRREFVRVIGGTAAAVGAASILPTTAEAAPTRKSSAETTAKRLYESLSDDQKLEICFPFDHQKRKKHDANWAITEPKIGSDFYTDEQRGLIAKVLREVSSEEGYELFRKQMKDDTGRGFGDYHVALFGKPDTDQFEWELTGRHLTMRADGNSVENMAFGGPIVYGHGESDPKKNLFHHQTKQANEVFQSLDAKHVEQALLPKAPPEGRVPLQGEDGKFPGLSVADLSSDQKDLVEKTIKVILSPYREEDVKEAVSVLKAGGGMDKLHMAFYQTGDLNKDEVWDIWRLEGPTIVWHFRGAPHVHAYVNVGKKS